MNEVTNKDSWEDTAEYFISQWTLGDTGEYFMSCAQLVIQKYNEYITQ